MIALIAGTGSLPRLLADRLVARGEMPIICAMEGFAPDLPASLPRLDFRLETLGTLLSTLTMRGVTRLCLAGAVRRPQVDPSLIDAATAPLIPHLAAAMAKGDDGALRGIIAVLEERGFTIVGAAEILPELLPPSGVLTKAQPIDMHHNLAQLGQARIAELGRGDIGQACILADGGLVASEDIAGTDAMIDRLGPCKGAVLFKAPKPGQELRADMPVIGIGTAMKAAEFGYDGLIVEADGVMVLDLPQVVEVLDNMGMFLWIRPRIWREDI